MTTWLKRFFCRHKQGQSTAMYRFIKGKIKRMCPGCGQWVVSKGRARSWY